MQQGCRLCPRRCGADRAHGQLGVCRAPASPTLARAAAHFGEEPCISGTRGSGAVFFSGCSLGCVFCQNAAISRGEAGRTVSVPELRRIFERLCAQGVHTLTLVTPTHSAGVIAQALRMGPLPVPVVWNSSGYERVETLRALEGLVQIWMPDYKYALPELAGRCSGAPDYPETARAALREMYRQAGRSSWMRTACCAAACWCAIWCCPGRWKTACWRWSSWPERSRRSTFCSA